MVSVIFLDVDGVLNSSQPDSPTLGIEDRLLRRVVDIAQAPNIVRPVEIVVSSDWRRKPSMLENLCNTLGGAGLKVRGAIPSDDSKQFGIRRWLHENGELVLNWVAIDDFDLQALDDFDCERSGVAQGARSFFDGHFLKTDETVGLTEQGVVDAISMLAASWSDKKQQLECAHYARQKQPDQSRRSSSDHVMVCDECGERLENAEAARMHMDATDGEHCMFSNA